MNTICFGCRFILRGKKWNLQKIQDKSYRQFFFYVLTHKSSWHFGKEFPVKLPVARASGEHWLFISQSQVFILWEICTLFPYFCIMFPCFCTVFTKNCTALSQSDSRNFSTYIIKFYRKIHYLTREFHVKLHTKTDIGFQVQFNVEFTSQVMDFPWIA